MVELVTMSDTETLINTLISNGLASSRSEAQRMAESMLSTSEKVNNSMRRDRDNSMVKDYGEARRAKQASLSPQEQNIEELRAKALDPQPVQVQTGFDTPANDAKIEELTTEASREISPEFYAAQRMQNLGAQTVSDLTAEPAPIETVQEPIAESSPILETQEPEAPSDFIIATETSSFMDQKPQAEVPVSEQVGGEVTQEPEKRNLMTDEDKKLAEEVDLSRVFNFSNR